MKICEVCKKEYENIVHNQRFCSPECNKKAKICMCGCGEYTTRYFKYKWGHRNRGKTFISDEGRKAISDRMKADNPAKRKEVRKQISDTLKRKYKSGEIIHHQLTDKHKQTLSKRMTNNNPMHNKETAEKVGLTMKGKRLCDQNPNWKRRKIIICKHCKKEIEIIITSKIMFCNRQCYLQFKKTTKGKKECNWWLGGKSYAPYPPEFDKNLKKKIKERDDHRCQFCKRKKPNHRMHVHHIDYDKQNCDINNLITLCERCHVRTNFNRESWIPILKKRVKCL